MVIVIGCVLGMVAIPMSPLSFLISKKSPKSAERQEWAVGKELTIHLTVVTADYDKLACANPGEFSGAHCLFKSEKEPFPPRAEASLDDNKKHILQPYRTTDSQLVLMAGLWAQPEVATRLHDEPARGVAEKKLARFVVSCDVKFEAQVNDALVRWAPREAWSNQGVAFVASPKSCTILRETDRS